MIRKFLANKEDDNHPLLGPNIWGLKLGRLLQTHDGSGFNSLIYNLIHIAATFFVLSQYIELWFIRFDIALALENLSVTMESTICIVKAVTFVFWHKSWSDIINFVSSLELSQLCTNDGKTRVVIGKYTKYSRVVTYSFCVLLVGTVLSEVVSPLLALFISNNEDTVKNTTVSYPPIMSSWTPFERSQGFGYCLVFIEQTWFCCYAGVITSFYDSTVIVLMNFFAGQMHLLNINCSRLFENSGELTNHEAEQKIRECHNHHLSLLKYCKILDSVLSPVMFLYVIICSLMICTNAVKLTSDSTTKMEKIRIVVYLTALISQLLLYCWHSNEVLVMSKQVDYGVYKSDWWTQDVKIRRSILLLGGQLRKTVCFAAGPFVNLNVPTFIAILKGSYSYYTLLNQKKDEFAI
nr:unnamed protein product [Amyelois transitella]